MKRYVVILFFIFPFATLWSQGPPANTNTTTRNNPAEIDTTTINNSTILDMFYGNPGKAAFYGLIVPGGGQIYNKKWWKLPIVYALEGALAFYIYDSTVSYRGYQDAYRNKLRGEGNEKDQMFNNVTDLNILLTRRNKYRQQREYAWVFFIGGHLITIFEAFIDRHLMEFDVSDDLSFNPIPTGLGLVSGITYTIPLNKKEKIVYKNLLID